jgi:hypothetical protein
MWQNFLAVNFRCFGGLLLQPLERINLIAGKNNSGKTSVLEAIYLHSYPQNCQLAFRISELRGHENQNGRGESLVTWLFFDRKANARIRFNSQDDKGVPRELQMFFGDAQEARQQFPEADKVVQGTFLENDWKTDLRRIILKTEQQGKQHFAVGLLMPNGLASLSSKEPWDGPCIFLGSWKHEADEDVKVFSQLEIAKRQEEILPSLQLLEPRLKRLALIISDNKPVIHGDIGLSQLVPITVMGEGIRRVLLVLGTIATASGGRVLIDEIENGLHYSVLKNVWQAIAWAARKANVQIFATTHSWECLRWVHEAFVEDEIYDLRLHRIDNIRGEISTVSYDRKMIETALFSGIEMR